MGETEMPTIHFNRDRRRSSFTRPMRDPEEILEGLRSLKAAKRELGRTMSLSGDKRRESREYGYVASLFFLGLNHFRLNRSKSFAPPFQFRSSIRADCLPVCLSVSFFRPISQTVFWRKERQGVSNATAERVISCYVGEAEKRCN